MPAFPKHKPARDESYRRWVASTHCRRCRLEGYSQAAHPNEGKGLGTKTDDSLAFALCGPRYGVLGCHQEHDLSIGIDRAERRRREQVYIADQQMEALRAGVQCKEAA